MERLESNTDEENDKAPDELQQIWKGCFKRFFFNMLINSVLITAVMSVMLYFGEPIIANMVPSQWVHPVTAVIGLIFCLPFLWMLLLAGNDRPEVNKLWESGPRWRVRLTAYGLLRLVITAVFVSYFVDYAIPWSSWLGMFALIAILAFIFYSPHLERHGKDMVQNFTDNLNAREKMNGQK